MNTSEHILVIVLSVFLALFLVLAIVAVVQLLRLIKTLNHLAQKAEKIVNTAENVGDVFRHAAGPAAALRLVYNIVETVTQHNKKRGKDS